MFGDRIKEAIKYFNKNRRVYEEKMTALSLGKKCFPDKSDQNIKSYMTRIINNKMKVVNLEFIKNVKFYTGIPSYDFLFEY